MLRFSIFCLGIHALLVLYHFPTRHLDSDDPLASGDLSFYLASGYEAARGGAMSGTTASHMGGYHYGHWMSLGRKAYEAAVLYLPFGTPSQRFYVTIVFMALTTPLLLGLAARASGLSGRDAIGVAAFAAVVYQLASPVAYFWTFGNLAFPFASALSTIPVALLAHPTWRRSLLAGLVAGLAVWAHTIVAVPLALGVLAAMIVALRNRVRLATIALGFGVAAIFVIALVLPGHWQYLTSVEPRLPMRARPLPSGIKQLVFDFFNDRAYQGPFDRRLFLHLLIVLGVWQMYAEWRQRSGLSSALALGGLLSLAFNYAAGHLPMLRELQPYRFVVSAEMFLTVPAALGLVRFVEAMRGANRPGRAALIALACVLLPATSGHLLTDLTARRPAQGLSREEREVIGFLRVQQDHGRVLCEPPGLGNLLPMLSGREVIGGAISNHAVVPQRWASVDTDWIFGKPRDQITPHEFAERCRELGIRYCVVQSEWLRGLVEAQPGAVEECHFGPLRVYRLSDR